MPDFEAVALVRDFVELGGDVLLVIAGTSGVMWMLILERFWYVRRVQPVEAKRVLAAWQARGDHSSWRAHKIRRLMISEMQEKLDRGLFTIGTLVALCPMLGLLGTVTGMIEVFDVMAVAGTGNVRGMAGGVSKATLPTMAGMVVALSGMMFSVQLERSARKETQQLADQLVLTEEEPSEG